MGVSHEFFRFFNHLRIATEKRNPLVKGGRFNLQNPFKSITAFPSRLLCDHRHRVALVEQSEFPFRVF